MSKVTIASGSLKGTGTGGNVQIEFENGTYQVDFDDDSVIKLDVPMGKGDLTLDGEINGTYTGTGADLDFTRGSSKGSAKVTFGSRTQTKSFPQIVGALGLSGKGSAACSGNDLKLSVGSTTFDMVKDD